MFPLEAPPDIVIVLVAPLPVASTPDPTKFKVVAAVDKDDPSSCTVRELPDIEIYLVAAIPIELSN